MSAPPRTGMAAARCREQGSDAGSFELPSPQVVGHLAGKATKRHPSQRSDAILKHGAAAQCPEQATRMQQPHGGSGSPQGCVPQRGGLQTATCSRWSVRAGLAWSGSACQSSPSLPLAVLDPAVARFISPSQTGVEPKIWSRQQGSRSTTLTQLVTASKASMDRVIFWDA